MTCHRIPGVGFVCTRGEKKLSCVACGRAAGLLCDWKLKGKAEGRTCDRPVCERCSVRPAPDKDLCPAHAALWAKHPSNPRNQVPQVGHWKQDACDVYIGRGSVWGNPFVAPGTVSKHDVEESLSPLLDYEAHVLSDAGLVLLLPTLRGKKLGCFCVRLSDPPPPPERCHGHVLARLAMRTAPAPITTKGTDQ